MEFGRRRRFLSLDKACLWVEVLYKAGPFEQTGFSDVRCSLEGEDSFPWIKACLWVEMLYKAGNRPGVDFTGWTPVLGGRGQEIGSVQGKGGGGMPLQKLLEKND